MIEIIFPILLFGSGIMTLIFIYPKRKEILANRKYRFLTARLSILIIVLAISIGPSALLFFFVNTLSSAIYGGLTLGSGLVLLFTFWYGKYQIKQEKFEHDVKGWKQNGTRQVRRNQIRRFEKNGIDASDIRGYDKWGRKES